MSDVRTRLASAGPPLIVAHRGAWRIAGPENSRAAVIAAERFDMVEIDVRLASDGCPVVMHDDTLDRTTESSGPVAEITSQNLASIRLRESTETIPTLDEVLALGGDLLLFDIDVKEAAELDAVADFMARHPVRHRAMLKIDVQSASDIADLKALERRGDICVLAKTVLQTSEDLTILEAMVRAGVAGAEVWFADLALLKQAAEAALPLTSYTLDEVNCAGLSDDAARSNPGGVWGVLNNAGLRAIMTDVPDLLSSYLSETLHARVRAL